jgi:hypothetical protein
MGNSGYYTTAAFMTDLSNGGITAPYAAIGGNYYQTTIAGTTYDVAVLNLGENGDSSAQDQLIAWTVPTGNETGVPDGGSTLCLMGAALLALGALRRQLTLRAV